MNFKSKHTVTCDSLFIMNHHATEFRPSADGMFRFLLRFVSMYVCSLCIKTRTDEVNCISDLFTNYILTYNSSDRLGDFVGTTLLLLWMSLPTVASRQFVQWNNATRYWGRVKNQGIPFIASAPGTAETVTIHPPVRFLCLSVCVVENLTKNYR